MLSLLGAGLLAGVIANLLFGPAPSTMDEIAPVREAWSPPAMRLPDLAAADRQWRALAPRGAPPKPVEPPPPPPPDPPVPVGIVGTGKARQAIFLIDGGEDFRGGVGERLPDGGRILAISAIMVDWVDGNGQRHSRRMFIDPMQVDPAPVQSQ
jgi:hypothetical protein